MTKIIDSLSGTCRYCGQQTGLLLCNHQECRETHEASWQEMVSLVTQAARDHFFNEAALRQSLSDIANRSYATDEEVERALEEGWKQGVAQAMTDDIIRRDEEERLRAFRDSLALEEQDADLDSPADLDRASSDRVMFVQNRRRGHDRSRTLARIHRRG